MASASAKTSASAKSKRNNNKTLLDNLVADLSNDDGNLPEWWHRFALKISNLIVLLKKSGYKKYSIVGSGAVALLAYFYKPELLKDLKEPNDGDVYIDNNFTKGSSFAIPPKYNIGTYNILESQKEKHIKSATFKDPNPKPNCFKEIDLTMVPKLNKYVKLANNINIITPIELRNLYKPELDNANNIEQRKDKNEPKIKVLDQLIAMKEIQNIRKSNHRNNSNNNGNNGNNGNNNRKSKKRLPPPKLRNIFNSPEGPAAAPTNGASPSTSQQQPPKFNLE